MILAQSLLKNVIEASMYPWQYRIRTYFMCTVKKGDIFQAAFDVYNVDDDYDKSRQIASGSDLLYFLTIFKMLMKSIDSWNHFSDSNNTDENEREKSKACKRINEWQRKLIQNEKWVGVISNNWSLKMLTLLTFYNEVKEILQHWQKLSTR